jgi:biopolymer transport protein ExbB/TolQ
MSSEHRARYQQGLDSFLVEARTLASFRHRAIVRVARFFEAHHTAYMVLEVEKGEPLKSWWLQHQHIGEKALVELLLPLLDAARAQPLAQTLEAAGRTESQLTRRLRDAPHRVLAHLQFGQVLLASVGSTAPFVGLFGTVWGIYHALGGMSAAGGFTIDKVSGPIGEALIMTAAGIAVAVPAVLGYNVFGKWIAACEAELEGFAFDLRELPPTSLRSVPPEGAVPQRPGRAGSAGGSLVGAPEV